MRTHDRMTEIDVAVFVGSKEVADKGPELLAIAGVVDNYYLAIEDGCNRNVIHVRVSYFWNGVYICGRDNE